MLFTTPSSIKVAKTFFIIIKIIGPINIPSTPINLKPVYMAINVKIGCVPMCLLTNLGSKNCLTVDIIISKTIIAIPNFKSPFNPEIIAHGTITVPEPKIGSASTNPINNAINNGNSILKFANFSIYKPTKEIIKETNIRVDSAFRYPPNVLVKSLICVPTLNPHLLGK